MNNPTKNNIPPNSEWLDIVNENDMIIGKAPRNEIYQKRLMHRIVHVLIFNDEGEMAMQLRSKKKSFCPLHWSTTVGGHVQTGENYEQAALREYQEELGTVTKLHLIRTLLYRNNHGPNKFLTIYRTTYNGPFTLDPNDVELVKFFNMDDIKYMIKNGEKFHPELLFILERIF